MNIATPDVDPEAGLVELPEEVVDSSQQIAATCSATQNSRFVVTGRGGLPDDPTQVLRGDRPWTDLRDLATGESSISALSSSDPVPPNDPTAIVTEATRWTINRQGQVELVASQQTDPVIGSGVTCAGSPL